MAKKKVKKNSTYFDHIHEGAQEAVKDFKDANKKGTKLKFDTVEIPETEETESP